MIFDLEKEALIASGLKDDDQIAGYQDKIQFLHGQFMRSPNVSQEPLTKARQVFDWLWAMKPSRYQSHGGYKLHEVIDSQLGKETQAVGNCLGLTLVYNCLLRKSGLKPEALYLENAFGIGPHVLSFLRTKNLMTDVENIFAKGFDYKGHLKEPTRTVWGDKELVADIYHSRGNESFEKGEFPEALNHYKMAVALNPQYGKVRLNMIILSDRIKMGKKTK